MIKCSSSKLLKIYFIENNQAYCGYIDETIYNTFSSSPFNKIKWMRLCEVVFTDKDVVKNRINGVITDRKFV